LRFTRNDALFSCYDRADRNAAEVTLIGEDDGFALGVTHLPSGGSCEELYCRFSQVSLIRQLDRRRVRVNDTHDELLDTGSSEYGQGLGAQSV
jgi:hypothetical protein